MNLTVAFVQQTPPQYGCNSELLLCTPLVGTLATGPRTCHCFTICRDLRPPTISPLPGGFFTRIFSRRPTYGRLFPVSTNIPNARKGKSCCPRNRWRVIGNPVLNPSNPKSASTSMQKPHIDLQRRRERNEPDERVSKKRATTTLRGQTAEHAAKCSRGCTPDFGLRTHGTSGIA